MDGSDLGRHLREFQRCVLERDGAVAEQVLDPDFGLVLVHPEPVVMPRSRWLQVLTEYVVHEWTVEEQRLDVDPDGTAALLQRVHVQATVLGEDRSGPFVISDFWRLREGTWRIWRRHSTPLSAGVMPGGARPAAGGPQGGTGSPELH